MSAIQEEIDKAYTYPAYKPSNIDWIEEIPSHWEIGKLKNSSELRISSVDKHIFENERKVSVCNYTDVYYNEFISKDLALRAGSCTEEEYNKYLLKKGDVIITKDSESPSDIGVPSIVIEDLDNVVCGYHLSIITPFENKIHGFFLFRQLQTKRVRNYFEICSNGITRFGLGKSSVLDLPLILPPLPEQQAIVTYLDQKTALIDELIGKKQRKIGLLKEQRTALINHAVTKGLNPDVNFKDSGIEWIGEIPEHWGRKKIKQISKIISKGTTPSTVSRELLEDGEIRYLKAENISDNKVVPSPTFFIDNETDNILSRSKLLENDILFVIAGATLGKVAILPKEFVPANTNQAVSFIRLKAGYNVNFAWYWLSSSILQEQIWIDAVQSAQPNLSMENLGNFHIPFPSLSEQQIIVAYLEEQTNLVDKAIALETQKIEKLKEYRQSLISAAVTGKICVLPFTERGESNSV